MNEKVKWVMQDGLGQVRQTPEEGGDDVIS